MKNKIIYMDNSASTKVDKRVIERMTEFFQEKYAVATSEFAYRMGIEASEALNEARSTIAAKINADPEEIIFTSGSTESSNLAIKGVIRKLKKKGNHIIVSTIEDFPVLNSAKALEREGFGVSYISVDEKGKINIDELEKLIKDETLIVSIQHGNQEIGTVQDIKRIAEICKNHDVIYHTDATHSFARIPIDVSQIPADLITLSAHTIHGPKGIGALYIRKGTPIKKILDGGFQESNLRAGVENIPGATGFAKAVELITEEENDKIREIRDYMIRELLEQIPHTTLNGHESDRLPQNVNITFHFVEGESITLHLDMRNIAVSTGSACFSRSLEASHVIHGIGGDHERAHGSVRFSLSRYNTMEEAKQVVNDIKDIIQRLREISPMSQKNNNFI